MDWVDWIHRLQRGYWIHRSDWNDGCGKYCDRSYGLDGSDWSSEYCDGTHGGDRCDRIQWCYWVHRSDWVDRDDGSRKYGHRTNGADGV
jgi:hypothetical protein